MHLIVNKCPSLPYFPYMYRVKYRNATWTETTPLNFTPLYKKRNKTSIKNFLKFASLPGMEPTTISKDDTLYVLIASIVSVNRQDEVSLTNSINKTKG